MRNILNTLIKTSKYFSIKSQGASMLPMLQPNDVLYFKKINFSRIRVNDFILIKKRDTTFTHRVIFKNATYLITKGDNNLTSDGKIFPRQIIGKVYQVKRNDKIFNPEDLYLIQSSLYFTEIIKIKKALEKEKIDFVFLKGLPLHLYYEGSYPRRIYADCDILIPKKNIEVLDKIFSKFYYQKSDTSLTNTLRGLKNKVTEVSYFKKLNNFPVIFDVHFEISILINQFGKLEQLYPESLITKLSNEFITKNKLITVQNETFPILSTENLILYLALHFFHHNFLGEYRLEFLAKIIKKNASVNWQNIALVINDYHLQNFVYPVFSLLRKYYPVNIPAGFLKSIQPSKRVLKYINNNILNTNIFDGETRIRAGVTRFNNLFYLSPQPLWRKLLIIFNPAVLYSIFWVLTKRLIRLKPR